MSANAETKSETSVWLGLKRCGCPVAVCVDRHEAAHAKDVSKTKREFLRDGLSVLEASWSDWETKWLPMFKADCQCG